MKTTKIKRKLLEGYGFWTPGSIPLFNSLCLFINYIHICAGLNNLFILVMTCMIIVNTINMGAQLDLEVVKEVFKKPIGRQQ